MEVSSLPREFSLLAFDQSPMFVDVQRSAARARAPENEDQGDSESDTIEHGRTGNAGAQLC